MMMCFCCTLFIVTQEHKMFTSCTVSTIVVSTNSFFPLSFSYFLCCTLYSHWEYSQSKRNLPISLSIFHNRFFPENVTRSEFKVENDIALHTSTHETITHCDPIEILFCNICMFFLYYMLYNNVRKVLRVGVFMLFLASFCTIWSSVKRIHNLIQLYCPLMVSDTTVDNDKKRVFVYCIQVTAFLLFNLFLLGTINAFK